MIPLLTQVITFAFFMTSVSDRFTSSIQMREVSCNFKDLYFVNRDTGYAVGTPHWDTLTKNMQGSVMRSVDGGKSWSDLKVNVSETLNRIICFGNENILVIGNSGTLIRSSDGGVTWSRITIDNRYNLVDMSYLQSGEVWITGNRIIGRNTLPTSMYKSTDSGKTWNSFAVPNNSIFLNGIKFVDNMRGWVAGSSVNLLDSTISAAVFSTMNGGGTWIEQLSGVKGVNFTSIDFSDYLNGHVVGIADGAGPDSSTIYRTEDGGSTWRGILRSDNYSRIKFMDNTFGFIVGIRYRKSTDAGAGPPILRTIDGGKTWKPLRATRETGEGLYGLWVDDSRFICIGDRDFIGIAQNPWRVDIEGAKNRIVESFQIRPRYLFDGVHFTNKNTGWIVGTETNFDAGNQIILKTNDGGSTWNKVFTRDTFCVLSGRKFSRLRSIYAQENGYSIAVGGMGSHGCDNQSSSIVVSNAETEPWKPIPIGFNQNCYSVYVLPDNSSWVLPELSTDGILKLIKIEENGSAAKWVNTSLSATMLGQGTVWFADDTHGWVVGGKGIVASTKDKGETWQMFSNNDVLTGELRTVHFSTPLHGWIGGDSLYETVDGGNSWTGVSIGFFGHKITCIDFSDSLNGWIAGEYGMVAHTVNGGRNWTKENPPSSLRLTFTGISAPTDSVAWATGPSGLLVRFVPVGISQIGTPFTKGTVKKIEYSVKIHEGKLLLFVNSSKPSKASFELLNLKGQVVLRKEFKGNKIEISLPQGIKLKNRLYVGKLMVQGECFVKQVYCNR